MNPVVQLDRVSVRYGRQQALRDVSATFPPGAVGLLGPNGAGKSTMLQALLGFVVPDQGQMRVLDLDVKHSPLQIRSRIGYMPESDAHIPGMNAVSFVAYCGELSGLPHSDAMQRAHEVLYYVGLGEARYRNVETYSTGMKQRIKLAQALVHDPDLLFLDEPTNGMDPKGRDEMLELIRDIAHNKGLSLILSSHLLPDVEYTCDHVVVMDKGAVATEGPIAGLKEHGGRVFELRVKGDAAAFVEVLHAAGPRMPRDRGGHHARLRAAMGSGGQDARRCSSWPPRTACRCGICGRACRRSKMSSRTRSERVAVKQRCHPRSGLSPVRRAAAKPHGRTWWVIARAGMMERLRERKFLGLLLVAWLPFLVRAVQLYVAANFAQAAAFLAPTPATFREFLDQQSIFVFFITIYVGSGLIANDRRANALQIYLSKPLTRVEYIAGKLATLVIFLTAVTWVPGILLLLLQMMFAGNLTFLRANLFLFPAITLFSAVQVLLSAFAMLALSSLSKSRRFVAIMYAGLIFFTAAMYQALRGITGSRAWAVISPEDVLDVIADVIFRSPGTPAIPCAGRAAGRRACSSPRRSWCSSAACAASRWSRDRDHRASVEVVRAGVRPQRRHRHRPAGITGLLGPNGAGKSTFMKLITGQLKPSKGAVRVLGEPIWGNPGHLSAHRLLPGTGCVLRPDDRPRLGDRAGAPERIERPTTRAPRPSARSRPST